MITGPQILPTAPTLYVLKRYPRLSETFIVREILGLEAAGQTILIDSLLPCEKGPQHPDVSQITAAVRYVPRHPKFIHGAVLAAHVRVIGRAPTRWTATAWRSRHDWRRFLQAGMVADRARRERVGSLHAHFATSAAEVARDASALTGIPFVVTAHAKDIFHHDYAAGLAARVRGASAVVTVSQHNVTHLIEQLPGTNIRYIANGVPVEDVAVDNPTGTILCVARLVPKKGIDTLIRAMAAIQSDVPGARVEIAGGGPELEPLQALAQELGASDAITFLGPLTAPQVSRAYERAAIVVAPCRVDASGDRDGLPTVLLEAMSRGIAVVSTDVVGIPELVRHEQSGLIVPPDNPAELAAAIVRLLTDTTLRVRLAAAGRNIVEHEYDPATSVAALVQLHRKVIERKSA